MSVDSLSPVKAATQDLQPIAPNCVLPAVVSHLINRPTETCRLLFDFPGGDCQETHPSAGYLHTHVTAYHALVCS